MDDRLIGGAMVVGGVAMVLLRRPLGRLQVRAHNVTWGSRMGAGAEEMSRWAFLIVGACFVLAGLAEALQWL